MSLTAIFPRVAPCFEKVGHPCCRKTCVAQYSYWTAGYTTEELGFDLHLGQTFFRWANPACGPGQRCRQADSLLAGPSGDQIPVGGGGRFSTTVQIGPVAHTSSCTSGTTSLFPEVRRSGRFIDHVPPSCTGLKKEQSNTATHIRGHHGLFFTSTSHASGPVSHLFSWNWGITTRGIKRPGREAYQVIPRHFPVHIHCVVFSYAQGQLSYFAMSYRSVTLQEFHTRWIEE